MGNDSGQTGKFEEKFEAWYDRASGKSIAREARPSSGPPGVYVGITCRLSEDRYVTIGANRELINDEKMTSAHERVYKELLFSLHNIVELSGFGKS